MREIDLRAGAFGIGSFVPRDPHPGEGGWNGYSPSTFRRRGIVSATDFSNVEETSIVMRRIVNSYLDALGRPGSDLLSRVLRQSTIGAEGFHGRVRNGIGLGPLAGTTRPAKSIREL